MVKVEVRNQKNKPVEKLDLADEVFGSEVNETLVWEAVRAYLAAQRKGTHATRGRAQVRGGGRKPWRQKGTGRARVGSTRSPLWRKGGTVFGPTPRDYTQAFPKKKRRGAMKVVLSDKLKSERMTVIDQLDMESHRTKGFKELLKAFSLEKKVLVVDHLENRNLYLSSRNLAGVKLVPTQRLNVYDVLNCEHVLISKRAILRLEEVLKR